MLDAHLSGSATSLPQILQEINYPAHAETVSDQCVSLCRLNLRMMIRCQLNGLPLKSHRLEGRTVALLRLRLKHELGTDAAALPIGSICLRRTLKKLLLRDCAPLPAAQLRHGKHLCRHGKRGLGNRVRRKRTRPD